jgi:septal ring factor EnvC (AmiA/AmiB activator)
VFTASAFLCGAGTADPATFAAAAATLLFAALVASWVPAHRAPSSLAPADRTRQSVLWTSAQVEDIKLATEPASKEAPMEARIARLESDVAHLREDVADVKKDVRDLRDKLDALRDRMDEKFEAVSSTLAAMKDSIAGVRVDIAATKVWALLLYFAFAAAMLGTMARGFGWL